MKEANKRQSLDNAELLASVDAVFDQRISHLRNELKMLCQARRWIHAELGVQKPETPEQPVSRPKKARQVPTLTERIYDCIVAEGPATASELATKLDTRLHAIRVVLGQSDWFEKTFDGKVTIAKVKRADND